MVLTEKLFDVYTFFYLFLFIFLLRELPRLTSAISGATPYSFKLLETTKQWNALLVGMITFPPPYLVYNY